MSRITHAQIAKALKALNEATNSPVWPCKITPKGTVWNPGNWHAYEAYGASQLQRVSNESGGTTSHGGYGTLKQLLERIEGMIAANCKTI